MSADSINSALCGFQTIVLGKGENKRIILQAKNKRVLIETFRLIAQYTHKISPKSKLQYGRIKKLPKNYGKQARFQAEMQGLLSPMVRHFFGRPFEFGQFHLFNTNCHGTALQTAGLFPLPLMMDWTPYQGYFCDKMREISLQEVEKGDIVRLPQGGHSFVFLSDSLCLSVNGRYNPLLIYPTSKVLTLYKYPADALQNPPADKKIVVYRKKNHEEWFDDITPTLTKYLSSLEKVDPWKCSPEEKSTLLDLTGRLQIYSETSASKTQLSESTKIEIRHVYKICQENLPFTIRNKIEDTIADDDKTTQERSSDIMDKFLNLVKVAGGVTFLAVTLLLGLNHVVNSVKKDFT